MSKTQSIRDALAGGKLAFKKLHEIVGGDDKKLNDLCCYLRGKGEVTIGTDDDKTITLKKRKGAPPQAKGKKSAGRKPVREHAPRATNGAGLRQLALENFLGAGALLRQAIEDGVEDLDTNHALRHAIDNHTRAETLYTAAQT